MREKAARGKNYEYYTQQTVFPCANQNTLNKPLFQVNNQLCLGTDHEVMAWLLDNGYQNSFDCIYIDPPYLTDSDYYAQIKVDTPGGTQRVKQRVFRDIGYRNLASYLQHIYESIAMIKELLSEQGSLFIHLDYHSSHYVKIILDEVFLPSALSMRLSGAMEGAAEPGAIFIASMMLYFGTAGERTIFLIPSTGLIPQALYKEVLPKLKGIVISWTAEGHCCRTGGMTYPKFSAPQPTATGSFPPKNQWNWYSASCKPQLRKTLW